MSGRGSGRAHKPVNYNEKAGGGGSAPAWALQLAGSGGPAQQSQKENSRPKGAVATGRKSGAAKQLEKAPVVAQKGRDAGLQRLPIEDDKGKAQGSGKARGGHAAEAVPAAAAGKQVLPGVYVKGGPPAAKPGSGGKAEAAPAAARPASKSAGAGPAGAATKPGDGLSSKRKAASQAAEAQEAGRGSAGVKQAAKSAPAAVAAEHKRQRVVPAAAAAQVTQRAARKDEGDQDAAERAAPNAEPGSGQGILLLPGSDAQELLEQTSANFRALQAEYDKLQALYEDLKAAKIDEEVQQLLEQQNRYVSEHGQKAAALVEHYKKEAQHHAAVAAQLGGDALVEQCNRLQADLMNCQQALLDKEAENVEKERRLVEMAARLAFLERYARVYDACDKCIQTDDLAAGDDASAQFPSIQSSGVEMLQAHALVPEGAGGGSVYRRPRAPAGPPAPDTSYTLPAGTMLAGVAAAAAAGACEAALTAAGGAPLSGSDMELTGVDASQPQQQAQQQAQQQMCEQGQQTEQEPAQQPQQVGAAQQPAPQRRQSLQPVAGRVAHAAAGPALRPASAESQVQLVAPRQRPSGQRRASLAVVPAAAPAAVASNSRRLSAPPAPVDRELRFTSASTVEAHGHAALPAVPEEEPLAGEVDAAAGGDMHDSDQQQHQLGGAAAEEPPPFEFPQMPAPAASVLTAPPAARGGAPTPASVPAPPRDLAITALTGLTATPVKGGIYQYCDPRTGFTFELGPAAPDSADLGAEEVRMWYRPVELGTAAALLPTHFHEEISFVESQKQNFFQQLMYSLNQRQ